jgi:hypothetical protein
MHCACVYSQHHKTHVSVMKRTIHLAALAGLVSLMIACTPALDWREVSNSDAGYRALFPGKAVLASRDFVMAGEKVTLKLHATTSGNTYFAIGEIPLSAAQQDKAGDILAALKASMRNNAGALTSEENTVSASGVVWQEVRAKGQMPNGAPSVFVGRFAIHAGRILEVVAMGEKALLTDEAIDMWFGSVVLDSRP